MKITCSLLCALLLASGLLVTSVSLRAAPPSQSATAQPTTGSLSVLAPAIALSHRVERLKLAFLAGDPKAVQGAVDEVEVLRRTFGTHDVTPLVEALCLWARDQKDAGMAMEVLRVLERWAPDQPVLLGTRIMVLRRQGPQGYLESLPDVLQLTRLRLGSPAGRWMWLGQHMAWLRMMASVLLWGWAVMLALRYRNVFRYLWEEPLSRKGMGSLLMAIVGAVLLAAPVLAGADPAIAAMLWLVLLAPFMYGPEVKASLFILLLQLVHPGLALLEPGSVELSTPSLVALQIQPQTRPLDQLGTNGLPPADQEFLRGWQQLVLQDWPAAETTFAALSPRHPDRAEVLNNLGVARFQQGKLEEARKDFDEAARASTTLLPEIPLNQSVVAFKRLDSGTGIAKQEEARMMAPDYVKGLMTANQSRIEQRTFAIPLQDTPARISAISGTRRPAGENRLLRLRDPRLGIWTAAVLLAMVVMLARLRRSMSHAYPTQCTRCGEPFHTTDCHDVNVCSKCHHLFILKDGLHGESRKRKVEEVGRYQLAQQWIHKLLVILAPGLDLGFLGATRQGFLEFGFLAFALGIVFATGPSVRYPGEVLPDPVSTWRSLGLALLVVLFLRSWIKLIPRRRSPGMR